MISTAQKFRLGLFISLVSGALILFFLMVAGNSLWEQRDIYYIRYNNASVQGLQVGGAVVYQGINVGSIKSVEIDPENVENIIVTISLEQNTPIKTNVSARLVPVGITGLSQIELSGGTQEAALLPPGSTITPEPSSITQVSESLQSILNNIQLLLEDISSFVTEENRRSLGSILSNVDGMVAENRTELGEIVDNLNRTSANLTEATREASLLVGSLRKTVEAAEVEEAAQEFRTMTAQAGELVDTLDSVVFEGRDEVLESIEVLNDTVWLLNDFAFQLSENPSLIIFNREDER
jgi:phospholipid/cholesterol/gamma-HCH transport system substrate-binding protein